VKVVCKPLTALFLFFSMLSSVPVGAASIDPRMYQVEAAPTDCVNTFIIRMVVAASRTGRAYGVYADQEFFLERLGTPDSCSIDMATFTNNQMTERKSLKCVFNYPFDF